MESQEIQTVKVGRCAGQERSAQILSRGRRLGVDLHQQSRTLGGTEVTFHSVSFTRSYKGADGVWKYTHNFDANDLGKVITVAKRAAEFIHEQQQQQDA